MQWILARVSSLNDAQTFKARRDHCGRICCLTKATTSRPMSPALSLHLVVELEDIVWEDIQFLKYPMA